MSEQRMVDECLFRWRNPWFALSVGGVAVAFLAAALIGFVWLPSGQSDLAANGLWAMICRAAGVPQSWLQKPAYGTPVVSSSAVLTPDLLQHADASAIGRGAALAATCDGCHLGQSMGESSPPALSGQYPEAVYKQLLDFKGGQRSNDTMQAMVAALGDADMRDLSVFYGSTPVSTISPASIADHATPALIRVGDPLRNIAPCGSCHGGIDRKTGSPRLDGAPAPYLQAQLRAFALGVRHNDINGQMRNVARAMTAAEMESASLYYASRPTLPPAQGAALE